MTHDHIGAAAPRPPVSWAVIAMPPRMPFEEAQLLAKHLNAQLPARYLIEVGRHGLTVHLFTMRDPAEAPQDLKGRIQALLMEGAEGVARQFPAPWPEASSFGPVKGGRHP